MAEDRRPPPQAPLPRRVPGANAGPTPPQELRRGVLPRRAPGAGAESEPPQGLPRRTPGANSGPTPPQQLRRGVLPRRAPGASAARKPPQAPRPLLPVPQQTTGQGSVGSDVVTEARAAAQARVAAEAVGTIAQRTVVPPRRGQRARRPGRRRTALVARRWRVVGGLASILLIVAIGGLALALSRHEATGSGAAQPGADGGQRLAAAAAARSRAVAWVTAQVSRDVTVACDPVICSALAARGFPAGSLLVLQPTTSDPLGSNVVIATADIRDQFGNRLAAVYAPAVIASFGTGNARIDIRAIAPDGAAAYRSALSADLAARKASGTQLLHNTSIVVSDTARRQLAAGQVDSRLLVTIPVLAAQQPIHIVEFGSFAPGAGQGIPLRFADLAETAGAAGTGGSGYVQSILALLRAQRPQYRPVNIATVRLADGTAVLRIAYAAPSPLGLLNPNSP